MKSSQSGSPALFVNQVPKKQSFCATKAWAIYRKTHEMPILVLKEE